MEILPGTDIGTSPIAHKQKNSIGETSIDQRDQSRNTNEHEASINAQ